MNLQPGHILYRSYSPSSAGDLVCGQGLSRRRTLSPLSLISEFQKHKFLDNKEPTALVSTSSQIINIIKRSFDKKYGSQYRKGEKPEEIWILIIRIPFDETARRGCKIHHAQTLAVKDPSEADSRKFRHEYLFEWEIPERYVLHQVSLHTLIKRGLDMEKYLEYGTVPSTSTLRESIARDLTCKHGAYDTGLNLGNMSRCFGARALVMKMASQIFKECFTASNCHIDYDSQMIRIPFLSDIDFSEVNDIYEGIETAVIDWWLADLDFEEYLEVVAEDKMEMMGMWEEFWDVASEQGDLRGLEGIGRTLEEEEESMKRRHENVAIELGL